MRGVSLWRVLVGIEQASVVDVWSEELGSGPAVVISVRPWSRRRSRCGVCQRRCPGYDAGAGRRRWRTLDLGTTMTFVEADAPRVRCTKHGVVVAHVPWAEHGAGHCRVFDQQVAWLAVHTSKSAVTQLMRVAWRTVGVIVARAWDHAETTSGTDRLEGLRRIGIDEISYRRGQRYLLAVVDHDTGNLVWAADGRDKATLRRFFDELGPQRAALITHTSADGAPFIDEVIAERCPNAVACADPFHVVAWANDALTRVRIDAWNEARAEAKLEPKPLPGWARRQQALPARDKVRGLKSSRFALWKNPENLTELQQAKLAWVAVADPRLYRAYLLKEGLRLVFQLPTAAAAAALDDWVGWARRSRIPAFVELQRRVVRHRGRILAAIEHNMSNGLAESVNTKIRLITRIAFGFHSAQPLIALALLSLGPHRPTLPGRI